MGNYLEQLVAEWYEYRGYYVRRNINVGRRKKGGYDCELDIVAFNPETKHIVHIEPSMDAYSWPKRERRYKRKFELGKEHIPDIFKRLDIPKQIEIEQIALLVFASKENHETIGGGRIQLISELLEQITLFIKDKELKSEAISEQFVILRSFQFITNYFFLSPKGS